MSPKYSLLLLSVSFAVEAVSQSTSVSPSPETTTSGPTVTSVANYTATPTTTLATRSAATRTPSLSSANIASTSSVKRYDSVTSAVQPSSTSFPSSSSAFTVFTTTQSTQKPTTSDLSAKGRTIGGLEIMGFAILIVLGIIVATFAIYYFFYREKTYPEYLNPLKEHANGQAPGEVGITHKAFVGDAQSPTKVAAPEPEVKVVVGPEVTPEVKGNEGPVDSAL